MDRQATLPYPSLRFPNMTDVTNSPTPHKMCCRETFAKLVYFYLNKSKSPYKKICTYDIPPLFIHFYPPQRKIKRRLRWKIKSQPSIILPGNGQSRRCQYVFLPPLLLAADALSRQSSLYATLCSSHVP